jgi:hypothetical protein
MANLTSPGVQVQIIDESFYASAGPGTVPFIMMATAENKPQPGDPISFAPGTIKVNAGKLYRVASQRELLQTFGNPRFLTQAGTPQHGNELNEYGLYTAYQYLGIANSAYVMRADLDLNQLAPTSIEPVGEPVNGDYWLDLNSTTYGVFRSNGNINSGLAWGGLTPRVIDDPAQLQRIVQCQRATQQTDVNSDIITSPGTLVIAGESVAIGGTATLNQVVQSINNNTNLLNKGIRAELFSRLEKVSGIARTVYNIRLTGSDIAIDLSISTDTPTLLTDLGFENAGLSPISKPAQNYITPVDSFGSVGDIAVNAVSQLSGSSLIPSVQLFEKISQVTEMGTVSKWYAVGGSETQYPGHSWTNATPTVVNAVQPSASNIPAGSVRVLVGGVAYDLTFIGGTLASFVNDLNSALSATSTVASTFTVGTTTYLRLTDYNGQSLAVIDVLGTPFESAGLDTGTTYYQSVTGNVANPVFYRNGDTDTASDNFIRITIGGTQILIDVGRTSTGTLGEVVNNINATTALVRAEIAPGDFLRIVSVGNTPFKLSNVSGWIGDGNGAPPLGTAGIDTGITYGNALVYQGYTVERPQPNLLTQLAAGNIWVNTAPGNRGTNFVVKRYNSGTNIWNTRAAPLYVDDTFANAGYGATRTIGSLYVQYAAIITPSQSAVFLPKIWNGTAWTSIPAYVATTVDFGDKYTQSFSTPTGLPADGALWYTATPRVDIMVSTGSTWQGYRVAYPNTDPNGAILSATEPSEQTGGASLVDNDIWIDTSDLENYPKIYRRDAFNSQWLLIDNTDQSSSSGIVFADARWTDNGTSTGSQAIADMLTSNTVDSDAPSALPYPSGLLLFNTRYSTGNVKQYRVKYLPAPTPQEQNSPDRNRWVTTSGLMGNGAPYMLRKAQRQMVVRAMASALVSNEELKSETNFFNLLASPGYPELLDEMVTLNTNKKDPAFIILDTPARLLPNGTSIQNWATNAENATGTGEEGLTTSSRYAALYYPWGLATNLDGSNIFVPPSTSVLRTFAFNDQVAYPWFAPAGFTRGLVSAVSSVGYLNSEGEYVPVALNQGQRDVLYENRINPIAFIPGRGLVIYGQKTLNALSSALDRVNVARLVNFLNYQLDNLAKPFLFEPNDQYTRDSVTRTFESFFGDLVSLRAVFDFAVLCDETNNRPERIDRNELWIDVAIKPTKAIEFIYIPLRILNTGDPLP